MYRSRLQQARVNTCQNRPAPTRTRLTVTRVLRGELSNLSLSRVLSQCSEQVSQRFSGDGTSASFVEEGEGLSDFRVLGLWAE